MCTSTCTKFGSTKGNNPGEQLQAQEEGADASAALAWSRMELMRGESAESFNVFNCSSDFSRDGYASLHTPPSMPGSEHAFPTLSNWTVMSSLREAALLGERSTEMPLLIRVRGVRVLAGATAFVAVLLLVVGVFMGGVPVGSRDSVASLATLNEYNFYTGTAAAVLAKPFEMALAMFVPVLSLVLSPVNSLQNESIAWRALTFCAHGLLVALITGAFSTLNVQQLDPLVVPVIVTSDLTSSLALPGAATASDDIVFALRPTYDTMLRTAMLPVYVKSTESRCQGRGGWPNIATTYAFFANDWLVDLLPHGREAEFSLHTRLAEVSLSSGDGRANRSNSSSFSAAASSSPKGFNATLSANLLLYAMFFSQTLLAWEGLSYLENNSLASFQEEIVSWRAAQDDTMEPIADSEFQLAASTMLRNTLREQSLRTGLTFDTDAASFNVSHVALSDDIDFDAVTIEIPFNGSTSAATASGSTSAPNSSSSLLYRLSPITECGETACLIPPPADSFSATATLGDADYSQWNIDPQIQAFAACVFEDGTEYMTLGYLHGASCTHRSTTSFLVYGFARRVVADNATVQVLTPSNSSSRIVTVSNTRRYHTITLGRLSWRTKDLASEFNATCGATDSDTCTGLSFPLDNPNASTQSVARHLIVGESHLPVNSLGDFDGLYSRWTPLAMITTPTDIQGDLLFKRNVGGGHATAWQDLDGQCSTSVDVFATQVEQNRWHMGYGFQESYTAALFLLFQNAVVREEKESVDGSRTLDFAGSGTHVTLEAQIPLPSALISIVGSAIVLVGAACIVIVGRRKEVAIQRDVGVEEIAKVLLVEGRFPKLFLDCTLDDPDGRRRPLHTFGISALVLHQTEPHAGISSGDINGATFLARYPPHA
ncbi:unnamed protein product [Phytophthora fragariaefolia]|uniref:Unnamed protein product n=1 Tax=Phytophthora fragariaefolia TaxID=1490495 RepID=A0A9W6YNX6_9STRA|nr:unnamed protein product [Phytophthora fragariaefolia]